MKYIYNILKSIGISLIMSVTIGGLTACNDDIPDASYYTFTGETMRDFLETHEDFSLFKQIVERAGRMDYLNSRGSRTFFPATNSGVESFLQEMGYNTVEDISQEYCDTLVKACIIERIMYTYDLPKTQEENNGLGLPLIIVTDGSTTDTNGMTLSIINRRAAIINELKNDSVENGVVHPVNKMLVPNTSYGSGLLDENHEEFSIYYEALRRTALLDSLANYRDENYEVWKNNYEEFTTSMHIGNENYVGKRPDHRYRGYTLYIVPDSVLYDKYGERFNKQMTMDEKIQALYDLAVEKYGDGTSKAIFGITQNDVDKYWNINSLKNRKNPLNMFMSYHILDRLFTSTAKMVNCWGVNTAYTNPTDWVSTMLDFSTVKLEKVYRTVDPSVEYEREFYLNHSAANIYTYGERIRGSHLTVPDQENFSLNMAFYYVDDVLAYDQTMRNKVMNCRMRIDFITLWPELTTNNIRLCGNPCQAYGSYDNSETGAEAGGFNHYLPPGYLSNMTFNATIICFVQRPIIYWSSMHGDSMSLLGTSYDVTFQLPDVPPGTYELRLGYCALPSRGTAQIYVDGVAQGLPVDMTYGPSDSRVGGLYNGWRGWRNKDENSSGMYTTEELEENARVMRNNGYYSGAKSVYYNNDGTTEPRYNASICFTHYNQNDLMRRKICNVNIQPNRHHSVRIRSVVSSATNASFSLDYMELVPISICGAGGLGEDLY